MNKPLRIILRVLTTVITVVLALVVVFNIAAAIKRYVTGRPCETVLGLGTAIVITGSMEPNISVQDLVVIFKTGDYGVRDVVTYEGNSMPVTHRIVDKRVDENGVVFYQTKGDANNTADGEWISEDRIVGEVIAVFSGFGKVQEFIQKPIGFLTVTLLAGALILGPEYLGIYAHRKEEPDETEKKK